MNDTSVTVILDYLKQLDGKIDSLNEQLNGKIDSLNEQLSGRIDSLQSDVKGLKTDVKDIKQDIKAITARDTQFLDMLIDTRRKIS